MRPRGYLRHLISVTPVLLCLAAAGDASASLAPGDALSVEVVVPVLNHDLSQAHRQALAAGFRQAIAASLAAGSRAPETVERYILAYRVREQSQRDLFYRLRLEVWVDRRLLRAETAGAGGGR